VSSSALLVEPAHRCAPDYAQTLGPEVADLSSLAGFEPDPEQKLGLDLLFALDSRGKSAAFEFAVVCSRQNLKTGLFKQAALGWLFLTKEPVVLWTAHEFKTTREAHRDLAALIDGCAYLSKRLKEVYWGADYKAIELMSGQRLIFAARTAGGGKGMSANKNVLDEAFALRSSHLGALVPTLSVQPDPQLVYGSSAGLAESDVLRGIRDRGRAGSSRRLAYLEWCAPPGGCEQENCEHQPGTVGCALDRVENLQAANPLLGRTRSNGTGLTLEYVQAERDAMPPEEFANMRIGWWVEPGAAEIFGAGKWEACAGEAPSSPRMGALAIAVSEDLSSAAIGAASVVGERVLVKPLRHGPRWDWVSAAAAELARTHQVPVVVDGRGPAATLIPSLKRAGVGVHVATTGDVLDAFSGLFALVTERRLLHGRYPELDASINGATTRNVQDRKTFARRASTSDLTPAESVMLAAWWVSRPQSGGRPARPVLATGPQRRHELDTIGF
jgi:hypothetical protein